MPTQARRNVWKRYDGENGKHHVRHVEDRIEAVAA
jgi:hypothetical protein